MSPVVSPPEKLVSKKIITFLLFFIMSSSSPFAFPAGAQDTVGASAEGEAHREAPVSVPALPEVLADLEKRIAEREARLETVEAPVERAQLLLEVGRHDEAWELVPTLLAEGRPGQRTAARILFAVQDFARLEPLIPALSASIDEGESRRLVYRFWISIDDLARLERALDARIGDESSAETAGVDLLARGRLELKRHRLVEAKAAYSKALEQAEGDADRGRAHHGLGLVAHRREDAAGALSHLLRAVELSPPDPELLVSLLEALLRVGRASEAIDAAQLALELGPYNERAHYQLGNGYTRKNYTQLYAAYPDAFAHGEDRSELERADRLLREGQREAARAIYGELESAHPGWADVAVRLGSLAFARGELAEARRQFLRALELCPEYGRAHNGLAKTLEAERLAVEVHRRSYEERFAAAAMPELEGIERFVINWRALTPRHQKRVALSLAPWHHYLPVLIEAGASYYVKPLHELLSETPHQGPLRDQRIEYDSRLWDDVRGCGGFHTVTGIEDVERSIFNRYDTVLHELTHQVHAVLPAERKREIEALYRQTKQRDTEARDAFLSRYAANSVWEYFAEGAHAAHSPERDRFDTREITRERLAEIDPALERLVAELFAQDDVSASYAVAAINRGDDRLRRGEVETALDDYREALDRDAENEEAHAALIFALEASGRPDEALERAETAAERFPASSAVAVRRANTLWAAGRGLTTAIAELESAREAVRGDERHLVDLELGRLRWVAGRADAALEAFGAVLETEPDQPDAVWGQAAAHALAERWEEAWTAYDKAVGLRSGVVALRTDYGRDLIRAGELARAPEQIRSALLLDPVDPRALALKAWWALRRGHFEEARTIAAEARERGPWSDLARIVSAYVDRLEGRFAEARETLAPLHLRIAEEAPPEYVYRPNRGTWEQIHTLPAVERRLLPGAE